MMLAEFGSGQVLWSTLWLFLFVMWFWLLIAIFSDIFRDRELSGWGKAGWCLFVFVTPYLGIFVYLIARGRGMSERTLAQHRARQEQFDNYVRETAGAPSAVDQIARGRELLEEGTISQAEFEQLKRTALA